LLAHHDTQRGDRRHILTVNAEEYFHAGALAGAVPTKHWDRLEPRLSRNLDVLLAWLAERGTTATFFVLGWSAERDPTIVQRIVDAGHEVASRGYWPRGPREMVPDELREDLQRTREALTAAGAPEVFGYRSPRWLHANDLWIHDVLIEEGYRYDASVNPILKRFPRDARFHTVHERRHTKSAESLTVVPVSTTSLAGVRFAIGGGNYVRQFPGWMMRRMIAKWVDRADAPLVFYFTAWEVDHEQPSIATVSRLNRIRHYRNLERYQRIVDEYLTALRFCSVAEYLGLAGGEVSNREAPGPGVPQPHEVLVVSAEAAAPRALEAELQAPARCVSVVVPLYHEAGAVSYLGRTLDALAAQARGSYEFEFVLVDDGSRDATVQELQQVFGGRADTRILALQENRGVAGAILAGIEAARHEIVCSMDCDCTYDPLELPRMIPLIDGADLVTASPYHPNGKTLNVPRWRLVLSRSLSRMYSVALGGEPLYTWTSCFRVYRKSSLVGLELTKGGFLGVAELLIRLRLAGGTVREFPATLESRLLGASKMKTLGSVRAHLGLLRELTFARGHFETPFPVPLAASPAEMLPDELPAGSVVAGSGAAKRPDALVGGDAP
jgi:polysaccharide deacetylase family protein (PEP-CTERM system associated)